MHQLFIGGTGTGKTTAMELQLRQDIIAGRGVALIDPMGALYDRVLAFCAYRKAIGCGVPEIILCNPSAGEWVLPYNPFLRHDGDLSVQVDRRVQATLRAWGQQSGDQTPRLEKWLKCLFTVLIECNLTILEAGFLLDQHAQDVRTMLTAGLTDPFIRSKLEQLARYKPGEFLEQVESVENRLMRFLCSRTIRNMMGTGSNALDFAAAMDNGHVVLVNLAPSRHLSREQQRLIGSLLLTEFYETALTRKSDSRPFYFYVDEAARFVVPELGEALEQCRQKGLHFSLAFQHLAQFREEDQRLYKAVKNNTRTKLVFAVPDRVDAQELADDLFVGLAEPQMKFMHRRLNHLVEDIRQTSSTEAVGHSRSYGTATSQSANRSRSTERSWNSADSRSTGSTDSATDSFAISRGVSRQRTTGSSRSLTESDSHSWGQAETLSESDTDSSSRTHSVDTTQSVSIAEGTSASMTQSVDGEITGSAAGTSNSVARTAGESTGYGVTSGHAHSSGLARTHSSQEMIGRSVAETTSKSIAVGQTSGRSRSRSKQTGHNQSTSSSRGSARSVGDSQGFSRGQSRSQERGESRSTSVTDQPGVRHTAFWEEDPEHWTLEEQRWRASELVMGQQTGRCLIRTASGTFGAANIPQPPKFYIQPSVMLRFTQQFYQRYCLTEEQACQRIVIRQQELLALDDQLQTPNPDAVNKLDPAPTLIVAPNSGPIWNREQTGPRPSPTILRPTRGRRGPKADIENHTKTAKIVEKYGPDWTGDERLREICEELDRERVPIPKTWPMRRDGKSRSWGRAVENYAHLVIKAIKDRLKAAMQQELPFDEKPPQTSAED